MKIKDLVTVEEKPQTTDLAVYEPVKDMTHIDSRLEYEQVVNAAVMVKAVHDALDAKRKEEKEPFLRGGQAIDRKFKTGIKPAEDALKHLRALITLWERSQRAEEMNRVLGAYSESDPEKAKALVVRAGMQPAPETEHELCTFRKGENVVVVDWSKVDPKYLTLNEKAVKADKKAGILNESGLFFETTFTPNLHAPKE